MKFINAAANVMTDFMSTGYIDPAGRTDSGRIVEPLARGERLTGYGWRLTQTPLQQDNLRDPHNLRLDTCFKSSTSETATSL